MISKDHYLRLALATVISLRIPSEGILATFFCPRLREAIYKSLHSLKTRDFMPTDFVPGKDAVRFAYFAEEFSVSTPQVLRYFHPYIIFESFHHLKRGFHIAPSNVG